MEQEKVKRFFPKNNQSIDQICHECFTRKFLHDEDAEFIIKMDQEKAEDSLQK